MGKDSSEIRREIEETRARMGDTVEALGYKADVPSRVKENINDRVETVKGTISDVVDSVKDTLTGASGKVGSALGGAKRSVSDGLSGTTDKMGDATSNVSNSVQQTIGSVTDKLGGVTDRLGGVTDKLGSVTEKIPSAGDVRNVAQRGVGIAVENPLGLALGALAVGFLAGLAAPVTDIERETVGPIRDDLVERAKSVGSDVLEHGKQALQETAQSVVQSAVQTAQQHGQQVLSEAKGDSVHEQSQNGNNASAAGMPRDESQGGGLRGETLASGGTGSQTSADTGKTSSQYGVLLDEDDTLEPGKPGTASP
jgi:hypothetical protein